MSRFVNPTPKYTDQSGQFMPYGLLYFFDSGTNDDKTTFADVNETIANTQPLILNGDGSVPNCFYSGSAKVILVTNAGTATSPIDGTQQWERDPVSAGAVGAIGTEWDAISIYDMGSVVIFNTLYYVSIINSNQNNIPSSTPTAWTRFNLLKQFNTNESYSIGDTVTFSNDYYVSLTSSNSGNQPDISETDWKISGRTGAALVLNAGAQTIGTGSNTVLAFDSENYDDNAFHDNVTNNSRLTVPAGVTGVRISALVSFDSSATGERDITILRGGAVVPGIPRSRIGANPSGITSINVSSGQLRVSAGDYFEVRVFQDSGGDLDVQGGGDSTWFSIEALK